MVLKKTGLAAAVLLAGTQFAYANDLQINGFINVTGGVLDTNDIAIDGYDTGVSFDNGTLVGLQMSKKVNDTTSATVQLISRGTDNYQTEASWAYVTFAASDNTDIRAGRLRSPFFYYSDFLEVGYAFNWVRPPSTVYRLDAFSSISGVDVTHRFAMKGVDGSIQAYAGRYNDDFTLGGDTYNIELRRAAGLVLNMNSGNFGARLSYHQADLTLDTQSLLEVTGATTADVNGTSVNLAQAPDAVAADVAAALEGARALDSLATLASLQELGGADFGDKFTSNEDRVAFYQASVSYDNGSTAMIAEWTALDQTTALLNDDTAWLVSVAQRMGDATVHLTYTEVEDDLESGAVGAIQGLAETVETSIILGVRYDYDSSTALKFDIQHQDEELMNGAKGKTGMLYTLGMSLVF